MRAKKPTAVATAGGALAALLITAAAPAEAAGQYTIELVARSGLSPFRLPAGSSISSQPVSIDEDGNVAFRVVLGGSPPQATEGVFFGSPAGGSIVLTGSSSDPVFNSSIDAMGGRIAVADGGLNGGATVYSSAGSVVQAFPIGGTLGTSGFGAPTFADGGRICYRADFGFIGDRVVVDGFPGGVREQIEVANTFDGAFSFLFTPAANTQRQVVLNTIPAAGPTRRIVLFDPLLGGEVPGFVSRTVAESGPVWSAFNNSAAIGEGGPVAFSARRTADGLWEVNRWDPATGAVVRIAQDGDLGVRGASLANFGPRVNGSGVVAFRADDATLRPAAFVGDGTGLVRLVGLGDTVPTDVGEVAVGLDFGGTTGVQTLNSVVDINEAGQVAFAVFLEIDSVGVFVATPVADDPRCNAADVAPEFGVLNANDVIDFVNAFNGGGGAADVSPFPEGDGVLNANDVIDFVLAFNAGCP